MTSGYRALREHAAWVDFSERGKIRVTGEDRARLLHAMSTNHIEQLKPGDACYAFFLNAQGRILADANILCFEDHLLLDTEPETRQKIMEHLDRYIIADDVVLEDVTDGWKTIGVEGPEAARALNVDIEPNKWIAQDSHIVLRLDASRFLIFSPGKIELEIPEASQEDARTVRIEQGRPRYGEEISERNLIAETDQLHGVHFNKGCYLGQEIVERVRSQAKIHRILRRLEIETTTPPPAGTKNDQLEIASAVFSPRRGKTVALAYVRSQFAEPGTELKIGDVVARVS